MATAGTVVYYIGQRVDLGQVGVYTASGGLFIAHRSYKRYITALPTINYCCPPSLLSCYIAHVHRLLVAIR